MAKFIDQFQIGKMRGRTRVRETRDQAAEPPAVAVLGERPELKTLHDAFPDAVGCEGSALPLDAGLRNFSALVMADQEMEYLIVGGRFTPSSSIDFRRHDIILSVLGSDYLHLSLSPASFGETGLGGYVASGKWGLHKTDMLLQPLSCGDWTYSTGIQGFVPESKSVTVCLTIGGQSGMATGQVFSFWDRSKLSKLLSMSSGTASIPGKGRHRTGSVPV